jgi:hypothetical protein
VCLIFLNLFINVFSYSDLAYIRDARWRRLNERPAKERMKSGKIPKGMFTVLLKWTKGDNFDRLLHCTLGEKLLRTCSNKATLRIKVDEGYSGNAPFALNSISIVL